MTMSGDDYGRLIYLVLLGSAVAGWFFMQNRQRLGKVAQQAAVWGLIFIGAIAAVGLWSDIRNNVAPRQSYLDGGMVEVPRAPDGHYYLTLQIDGVPVRFVIDTGASDMVLSRSDARALGIDPDRLSYFGSAMTANGPVRTARVTLDTVALGEIADRHVTAWVNEGEMDESLLGMAYLQRFASIEIAGGKLVLRR